MVKRMNINGKVFLKSIIVIFCLMMITSLIGNIFYYFDIFSSTTMKYYEMVSVMFSSFIGGYVMGLSISSKGYLYGLILSFIVVFIYVVLSIILNNMHLSNILYYLIVTFCITFGSMIGIVRNSK